MYKTFNVHFMERFKQLIREGKKISTIRRSGGGLEGVSVGDKVNFIFPYLDTYLSEFSAGVDRVHAVRVYPFRRQISFHIDFLIRGFQLKTLKP